MKNILFLIVMVGFSMQGFAQELNNKFKPIQSKKPEEKEVIPPKEVSPKVNPPALVEKPDPLKIDPKELFKDSNLYKKDSNTDDVPYRRNQYLGGFKTNSITSTIRYRDAASIDGDKVKIYLNDKVVQPEVTLSGDAQEFKINLIPGINKIDIEALNEGYAAPNTAEFQVYDDKGEVTSNQWNVGTGYKATIILYKE